MRLTLPLPPSANRLWRAFRGRTVLSAEGRAYKQQVAAVVGRLQPLEGEVVVRVDVYRARKSGDLDNRVKALLDALKGLAFTDDKQVVELHARRFDDKADPRVEVEVVPASIPASGDQDELRPVPGLPMMPQSLRALVTQAKAQLAAREVPDSSPSWAPKARVSSAYRPGKRGGQP